MTAKAIQETEQYAGARVLGVGRIVNDEGKRQGTCLIVEMPTGERAGLWYDRTKDVQGEYHGTLSVLPCVTQEEI